MEDIVLKHEDEIEEGVCDLLDNQDDELNLSYLLNLLQGCMTMEDSVVIMTTNKRDKLDPALFRDGRMNLSLELGACDHYQICNIFKKMKRRDIDEDRGVEIHTCKDHVFIKILKNNVVNII